MKDELQSYTHTSTDSRGTVSFLEAVSVLLRWRKVIIWFTGIATIAGLTLFVLLPGFGVLSLQERPIYELQQQLLIKSVPKLGDEYIFSPYPILADSWARSASILSPIYLEYYNDEIESSQSLDFEEGEAIDTYIINEVLGKQLKVVLNRDSNMLTLVFSTDKPELGIKFMEALGQKLMSLLNEELKKNLAYAREIANVASAGMQGASSELNGEQLALKIQIEQTRAAIEQLEKSPDILFSRMSVPQLIVTNPDRLLIAYASPGLLTFIAAFGGLFFSIILAFILDYVRRVKSDPAQMAKIKEALKKADK